MSAAGAPIATIYNDLGKEDIRNADAKLIATAPELLLVAKTYRDYLKKTNQLGPHELIDEVIAKAEGKLLYEVSK